MKLSKDDLIKKINEKVLDEDVKIELMEDVTDSLEANTDSSTEDSQRIEELETKYKNLQEKYKERFLKGSEEPKETEKDDDELEEKEIIDVKEI